MDYSYPGDPYGESSEREEPAVIERVQLVYEEENAGSDRLGASDTFHPRLAVHLPAHPVGRRLLAGADNKPDGVPAGDLRGRPHRQVDVGGTVLTHRKEIRHE